MEEALCVQMDHLVLIDGHHMMYRAYWAIPRTLKTSAGEQVNTVFGMASMLLAIFAKEQPSHLLFCFDEGDQTFRHQEHEEYKEGRAETPDDFYVQIPRVFELIDTFGLPRVSDPRYEADDFLGAYARRGEEADMRVTIVSGDRDVLQLVSDRVTVSIPHKGYQAAEYLDPAGVVKKYGITPGQVPAYKGLCGDASDNLPGVHGIGPKTAAQLIQQFGTLRSIYDHLPDIRPALAEKLQSGRGQAFFCEKMAQLHTDMPLPIPLDRVQVQHLPVAQVFTLFSELEFSLLSKRFQALLDSAYGAHFCGEEFPRAPSTTPAMQEKKQLSLF